MPDFLTEDHPRKPRVIINNLDSGSSPKDIVETIVEQNPELQINMTDAHHKIVPLFKRGRRESPTTSWICEVDPYTYRAIIENPIYVGFYRCRVSAFEEITQCYKCLQFGHPAVKCNSKDETCAHCAKTGHKRDLCPNFDKPPHCTNCNGSHPTTDRTCTKRANTLANIQRRTDYGNPLWSLIRPQYE